MHRGARSTSNWLASSAPHQVLLAGGRIVRHQQHARAAQRHGVFETRFAQAGRRDPASQVDGPGGVDAGLQAQMVGPWRQLHAGSTR